MTPVEGIYSYNNGFINPQEEKEDEEMEDLENENVDSYFDDNEAEQEHLENKQKNMLNKNKKIYMIAGGIAVIIIGYIIANSNSLSGLVVNTKLNSINNTIKTNYDKINNNNSKILDLNNQIIKSRSEKEKLLKENNEYIQNIKTKEQEQYNLIHNIK